MKFKSNILGQKNILYLIVSIWQKLKKSKKRNCFFVFLLMIFSGLLESVSIISVIPFLSIITGKKARIAPFLGKFIQILKRKPNSFGFDILLICNNFFRDY